jgi:hypothetical protein
VDIWTLLLHPLPDACSDLRPMHVQTRSTHVQTYAQCTSTPASIPALEATSVRMELPASAPDARNMEASVPSHAMRPSAPISLHILADSPRHLVPAALVSTASVFATPRSSSSWTTEGLGSLHIYIQIYFCNTQMKQLQHTPKTDETLGTYTYNICNI